jgi:hypothetical protein
MLHDNTVIPGRCPPNQLRIARDPFFQLQFESPASRVAMSPVSAASVASPAASTSSSERVLIVDAGAQYGKVIDRRVRELRVESVVEDITSVDADFVRVRNGVMPRILYVAFPSSGLDI